MVGDLKSEPLVSVPPDADEKEVFELFDKYNLRSLGVVDPRAVPSARSPWTTWSRACARICSSYTPTAAKAIREIVGDEFDPSTNASSNGSSASRGCAGAAVTCGGAWRCCSPFLGPGLITSNVDNDAGGISTYSLAGAQFGYMLLWSLIPMTIALYVTEEMCARMAVVTGKGLSDLIREEFGFRPTFFVMVTGFLVDLGNVVAEFAGWRRPWRFSESAAILPCPSRDLSFGCWFCGAPTGRWRRFFWRCARFIWPICFRPFWRSPTGRGGANT